jgi:hypothetical protein
MGSVKASSNLLESEGLQMNKNIKIQTKLAVKKEKKENYNIGQNLIARMLVFHSHFALFSPKTGNSYKAINVLTLLLYFCLHTSNQVL